MLDSGTPPLRKRKINLKFLVSNVGVPLLSSCTLQLTLKILCDLMCRLYFPDSKYRNMRPGTKELQAEPGVGVAEAAGGVSASGGRDTSKDADFGLPRASL